MHWIYLGFAIVMIGCGTWGLIAREKWLEKQSNKLKRESE